MKLIIDIPEEDYIRLRDGGMFGNVTTFKRAVREGIPLEQEPCTDAISMDKTIVQLSHLLSDWDDDWNVAIRKCIETVKIVPPVTSAEKVGHWISDAIQGEIDGQIVKAFTCSKCGAISVFRMTGGKIVNGDLCPNCGAKIQEVEECQ